VKRGGLLEDLQILHEMARSKVLASNHYTPVAWRRVFACSCKGFNIRLMRRVSASRSTAYRDNGACPSGGGAWCLHT
jgi:hypothetical protein